MHALSVCGFVTFGSCVFAHSLFQLGDLQYCKVWRHVLRSVWDQLQGQDAQLAKGQPPQPGAQEREFAGRVSKQGEGCHHFDVVHSV